MAALEKLNIDEKLLQEVEKKYTLTQKKLPIFLGLSGPNGIRMSQTL